MTADTRTDPFIKFIIKIINVKTINHQRMFGINSNHEYIKDNTRHLQI